LFFFVRWFVYVKSIYVNVVSITLPNTGI